MMKQIYYANFVTNFYMVDLEAFIWFAIASLWSVNDFIKKRMKIFFRKVTRLSIIVCNINSNHFKRYLSIQHFKTHNIPPKVLMHIS